MPEPQNHAECSGWLKAEFEKNGIDAVVSTEPFLTVGPYTVVEGEPCAMTCPHGVTFYFEPSVEQIAEWIRDGVA